MSRKQGKRNQRKQEKKRRAERAKRAASPLPTAYLGNKYRTGELAESHFFTERGIFQADLISKRKLTDALVKSVLQQLILQLRHGRLTSLMELALFRYTVGQEEMLLNRSIRFQWLELSVEDALPGRDSLIGVLRSILGSIETWTTPEPKSRGYLEYLEGFLERLGITESSFRVLDIDEAAGEEELSEELAAELMAEFDKEDEEEDDVEELLQPVTDETFLAELERTEDLLLIGRAWYRLDDPHLETLFRTTAEKKIDAGEAAEVAEICRQLIQESPRRSINADLTALMLQAAPGRL
jgi:hypothetical protein